MKLSAFCSRRIGAALALLLTAWPSAAAEIEVPSVLVKLIEQVDVPAREAGVLQTVTVREGQMVASGAALAQIDDAQARFEQNKAKLELDATQKLAANDVKVRYARKSAEVAQAELRRALESEKRLAESVSASELDQLRLITERTVLEIEQAEVDLQVARSASELKQNAVEQATHSVGQRQITVPLAGFVAEIKRHAGEWVQPGDAILRMLRLDRLRAEGLVDAQSIGGVLDGRPVTLKVKHGDQTAEYPGKIVFVSPEIDAVSGQVRVWAEIENTDLKLRPGLHGSLTIREAAGDTAAITPR